MGLDTMYTFLAVILVAVPVAVVAALAAVLAVGGIIGCTRCLFTSHAQEQELAAKSAAHEEPEYA